MGKAEVGRAQLLRMICDVRLCIGVVQLIKNKYIKSDMVECKKKMHINMLAMQMAQSIALSGPRNERRTHHCRWRIVRKQSRACL